MVRVVRGVVYQYGFRLLLGEVPRLVYGNDAGFWENYSARRELRRLRRAQAPSVAPDDRAEFLSSEGYLPLGKPFDPELVRRIADRFRALIGDPEASQPVGPRIRDAARALARPLDSIPEIRELLTDDLGRVLNAYYGSAFTVKHVRAWRNMPVPEAFEKQDVYSNLWHNDHDPVTLLRLFVYLTDGVTRHTGATHFHSIPMTRRIMRKGYLRRRAILPAARRVLEDPQRIRYFEGDVGSACLLNPQLCLHRAGVPAPGSYRDIVQFTIAPSDRPLAADWADRLPPDPGALA